MSDKFLVNKNQLSQILGVTQPTLTNWAKQKNNPLPVHFSGKTGQANQYDVAIVVQWYVEKQIASRVIPDEDGEYIDYEKERARLTKAQADGQELKNEITRGNLIDLDFAINIFMEIAGRATTKLDSAKAELKVKIPDLSEEQLTLIGSIYDNARNSIAAASAEEIVSKINRRNTEEL